MQGGAIPCPCFIPLSSRGEMGQSVSVDEQPADLKDLLNASQTQAPPFEAGASDAGAPLKHYVKVWRFERGTGHAVVDFPMPLCDEAGLLAAEPQANCSYLILHVRPSGDAGITCSADVMGVEELADRAVGVCTPRGLAIEVASQTQQPGSPGGGLQYSVFVWHGVEADPRVKARVFARAFELERLLGLGLLRRPAQAEAMQRARALEGVRFTGKSNDDDAAADSDLLRRNRLLAALVESNSGGATPRNPGGGERFPRLGLSVCRSLGLAPPPGAARQGRGRRQGAGRPGAARQGRDRRCVPEKAPQPLAAVPPVNLPVTVATQQPAPMPALNQLRIPGGKGLNIMPALNFSALREPGAEEPPERRRKIETPVPQPVSRPREPAPRNDGPVMLNLEEINVSEEELINSYDPDNQVNNQHLPDHLLKQLQLKQYRQMCSEIIENALYISSYQVASDLEVLRRHGITHIVNAAADVCDNRFPSECTYCTYYLKDINSEEISLVFYRTIEWIHNAISRGGRVLVHCHQGISRSSTFISAYLMWRFKITFEAALERVRNVRPICNPNTGFTCQLLRHAKKLGVVGGDSAPASDRPTLFRIAAHHPREPFLLLVPVQWAPAWSVFDPRFVWVVTRGTQCTCWIGAKSQAEPARAAVQQHVRWAESFERIRYVVTEVQEGAEPPSFWTALGLPEAGPTDRSGFSAPRAALDEDAEVLRAGPSGVGAGDAGGGAAQLDGAPSPSAAAPVSS